MRGLALIAVGLLAQGTWAPNAAAQPTPDGADPSTESAPAAVDGALDDRRARELYQRGDRLYAEGDYDGAIAAFEESYSLSERPVMLFNLANAYERAGRLDRAIEALGRYAPHAPEDERRGIERRIENLKARIAPESPTGAVGPADRGADATAQKRDGSKPDPEATDAPLLQSPEPERGPSGLRTAGWVVGAAGGALMIGGGVAGVIALGARSDANAHCIESVCREAGKSAIDRDRTASLVADVGLFAGAAALTTGVVLVVLGAPKAAEAVRVDVDGNRIALGYAGRF